MLPPASFYSLGRGLGLSLPFWVFVKVGCEFCLLWTVGGRPGRHTNQLRVSSQMKGLRTKKVQGSCRALLDLEIGIPQQRGEKLGENRIYCCQAIIHMPTSIFQIVKFFLCNHFLLKRKK